MTTMPRPSRPLQGAPLRLRPWNNLPPPRLLYGPYTWRVRTSTCVREGHVDRPRAGILHVTWSPLPATRQRTNARGSSCLPYTCCAASCLGPPAVPRHQHCPPTLPPGRRDVSAILPGRPCSPNADGPQLSTPRASFCHHVHCHQM